MNVKPSYQLKAKDSVTPNYIFVLYIYFLIDFFLHLPARIPAYGVIRPTLLLVLIISFLLFINNKKLPKRSDDPTFRSLIKLIIFMLVTIPIVSWPGSVLSTGIPAYVKAVVFFFFTIYIIDTRQRFHIFLFVFISCQVFRVLEPLYLNVTEGYWGDKTFLAGGSFADRLSGAPSDVVNPNGLGFVIVTMVPYMYYLCWLSKNHILKLIALAITPLLIYTLILTMSRGGFIALLVIGWMIFIRSNRKFLLIIFMVVGAIGVWGVMSDVQKDRYMSLISSDTQQSASAEGRMDGMIQEFFVALERPVVGHGLGTSAEAKFNADAGWMVSHNLYLEIVIEIGLIGLIIFIAYVKTIYHKYKKNNCIFKNNSDIDESEFSWRMNAALGAVFWMYIVYSINYFGLSSYYWYLYAGLVISFTNLYFQKNKNQSGIKTQSL